MMFLRLSLSPDWLDESDPLAMTKPAVSLGGQVPDELLNPGVVGVAHGRHAVLPALVHR